MRDDPEAATAEIVARGFLNATSVEAAAPFIYESSAIRDKLAKYYKPIATPGDYELTFKHRAQAGGGQTQFLYRVAMPDEKSRMLVARYGALKFSGNRNPKMRPNPMAMSEYPEKS